GLVPIPLPRLCHRTVDATVHAWARDHGRPVAAGGRPGEREDDPGGCLGADLMTHRAGTDRWVVMGRQVMAETFAGRREWMLADEPLDRWQAHPIAADHRTGHRLRPAGGRRGFSLASKRPHLALLLFGQPPIQILKKGQVGREETFNGPGGHLRHRAESGDHPGQQQDRQVSLVLAHSWIALRQNLVARRRQPHHAIAMHSAGLVDVAAWQDESEFRVESLGGGRAIDLRHAGDWTHLTRSKPSMTMVASSVTTSLDPALRLPVDSLDGQALMKFQRAISPAW